MKKKLKAKITVDYYTLNAKVLPVENASTNRYVGLIKNWYSKGYRIVTKGDSRHYYTLRVLNSVKEDKIFYGVITKYVSFEKIDFIDTVTKQLIPHPIPDNVEGRVSEYEFVFIPEKHRFAIIKIGKIDPDVKRIGAPLNKIKEIIKIAFDSGLGVGEQAIVEVVQEQFIFDEILSSDLLALQFRVSYTNDDILGEGKELMDNLMREDHIGEFFGRIKPDNTGVIDTDNGMTRGLIELARDNGELKATIKNDEGKKTVNTIIYPSIKSVESEKGSNRMMTFLTKLYDAYMGNTPV